MSAAAELQPEEIDMALTAMENRVLAVLRQHRGRVVPHRRLIEAVWGDEDMNHMECLKVHIWRIRTKAKVDVRVKVNLGYYLPAAARTEDAPQHQAGGAGTDAAAGQRPHPVPSAICAGPASWMCTVGYGHLCGATE